MKREDNEQYLQAFFFLGTVFFVIVAFDIYPNPWTASAAGLFAVLYFHYTGSTILVHSIFLFILSLTLFVFRVPSFWLFNLLLAIIVYLAVVYSSKRLRGLTDWLKAGRFDRITFLWIALVTLLGPAGLFVWRWAAVPDMSRYTEIIPEVGPGLLVVGIFGFSVMNALAEECVFRGILWEGFCRVLRNPAVVVFVQSVLFGLSHLKGVPNGAAGVGLATAYGILLGYLRHRSGGLAAPVAAHISADFVISLIVLKEIGRI